MRADNRDKSGINGDFLCAKGRFGFDFVESPERLTKPLVRNAEGKLEPATWEHALRLAASKLKEIRDSKRRRGHRRHRLQPDHQRRELSAAEVCAHGARDQQHRPRAHARITRLLRAPSPDTTDKAASLRDMATAPAILLIGGNPTEEHPLLAWNLRTNVRLNRARLYIANSQAHQAGASGQGHAASCPPTATLPWPRT